MRLRGIIFLSLIVIILMYPLSARAQVATPAEIHWVVTVEEVRQFIDEYKARFVKMDLDAFMELFAKDAVENKMIHYSDIREAYRSTVAHSKSIIYNLKIYSIQTYTRSAFVMGQYEIIQTLKKGGKERVFRGEFNGTLSGRIVP